MDAKKMLFALALPVAFTACSNDDLINEKNVSSNGKLVEVSSIPGSVISDASRGSWNDLGKWSWIPKPIVTSSDNSQLPGYFTEDGQDYQADEIGLCWTGEAADGTSIGADGKVYSNYEFTHHGWLQDGETYVKVNQCTGDITNDVDFSGFTGTYTKKSEVKSMAEGMTPKPNLNTSIFTTSNKAIFGGSYIVYYPYNKDFKDVSYVPATSPSTFDIPATDITGHLQDADYMADNTFTVGYAPNLIGGSEASAFKVSPLSGFISLQIAGKATETIDKVVLYSENAFVTSVGLNADLIKSENAKAGEKLYVDGTKQTSSTIIANINGGKALSATTATRLYIPVLPTTIKDLHVLVYAVDPSTGIEKSVAYALTDKTDYTVNAGEGIIIKLSLDNSDFNANKKYAVDTESLKAAVVNSSSKDVDVNVIGEITIDSRVDVGSNVNLIGGTINVPEDKILRLNNSTVTSEINVLGQTCCAASKNAGNLVVNSSKILGSVNVEKGYDTKKAGSVHFLNNSEVAETAVITNDGSMTFGTDTKTGATTIYGTLNNNKDVTVLATVNARGAKINNVGDFDVEDGASFSMLDASGTTNNAAGKTFVNSGCFLDKVGANIGGATQSMINNGKYICFVNDQVRFNEAYDRKLACNIIKMVTPVAQASGMTYDFSKPSQVAKRFLSIIADSKSEIVLSYKSDVKVKDLLVEQGYLGFENTASSSKTFTIDGDFEINNAIVYGSIQKANKVVVNQAVTMGARNGSQSVLVISKDLTFEVKQDIVLNAYSELFVEEDVQGMKADNLILNSKSYATFETRTLAGTTLKVANSINVKKGSIFYMYPTESNKLQASVECANLIEGGDFVGGKPEVK